MLDNKIQIISYKHNGVLHRVWQYAYIVRQTSDMIVLVNDRTNVIDGDGRRWKTKEPAVCYFFKNYWFNIICMLRNNAIYYYCNLSSPYVKDAEGLKYIDYDFEFNRIDYGYSDKLVAIIENELQILLNRIDNHILSFDSNVVMKDFEIYKNLRKQLDKKKKKSSKHS